MQEEAEAAAAEEKHQRFRLPACSLALWLSGCCCCWLHLRLPPPPSHRPLAWAVPPFRLSLLAPLAPAAAAAISRWSLCPALISLALTRLSLLARALFTFSPISSPIPPFACSVLSPPSSSPSSSRRLQNLTLSTFIFSLEPNWLVVPLLYYDYRTGLHFTGPSVSRPTRCFYLSMTQRPAAATPARPAVPPANHAAPNPPLKQPAEKAHAQGSLSPDSAARCLVLPPARSSRSLASH